MSLVGRTSENLHARTVQRSLLSRAETRPRASIQKETNVCQCGAQQDLILDMDFVPAHNWAVQSSNTAIHGFDPRLQFTAL